MDELIAGFRGEKRDKDDVLLGPKNVEQIVFEGDPGNLAIVSFTVSLEGKKIEVRKGEEYTFSLHSAKKDPNDQRVLVGRVDDIRLSSLWANQRGDDRHRELSIIVSTPKLDAQGNPVLKKDGTPERNSYSLNIPGGENASRGGGAEIKGISAP